METPESFLIDVEGGRITAQAYAPKGERSDQTLVLAHGAGGNQRSPFLVRFASGLSNRGIQVVTFNFLYMEQRKRTPDRAPKLESCYRAVASAVLARKDAGRGVFIGGKSLGGRIASHLAAAEDELARQLAGLVCLGYPLHPPGLPDRLRTAHLPRIRVPVLIMQGERDAFGSPAELRSAIAGMSAPVKLFVVEGGDHSFSVPKSWPVTQEQVYARVEDEIVQWLNRFGDQPRIG